MNYIDTNLPKIVKAKDRHYRCLRYIIKKKINGVAFSEKSPFPKTRINLIKGINKRVFNFLNNEVNLKAVLIGTPEELDSLKGTFKTSHEKRFLKKILNYDHWTDEIGSFKHYHAYEMSHNLDIPTCPYCNRLYTKTVIVNKFNKITRPTFDHWFGKAEYPLFALSFFNLIPSCSVCNSGVKKIASFNLKNHFHPYFKSTNKNETLDFSFSYELKAYTDYNFQVNTNNKFSKTSIEAFKLKEIYKAHEDEIKDLVHLRNAYSPKYLQELKNAFPSSKLSDEEIYRFAFGTHKEEEKFDRRPLSRMKRDILKELGII